MPFCDDVSLLRLYAVTVTESATTVRLMDIEILKNEELVLEHASVHTTCIAVQIKIQLLFTESKFSVESYKILV